MDNVLPFPVERSAPRLGRYRLIAGLGEGGMGTIHLAVAGGFSGFRKLFVVKELKPEFTHNEEFVRLFMREARLAARLSHPNVVHTIEADQDHGRYFMAMEFLDGQPFSELLRRAQKPPALPLALRLSVVCQALAGLHHAHELRDYDGRALEVVHRDVSPNNIFVTYDGQVKVLDFGVARARDGEGTQPRGFKGKIGYAAPEQLRMRPGDRRIDVFAAGIVLWEAIALRNLVRGKPTPQVFEARINGSEPRITQIVPELDPALAVICERAMAADPDERYASADVFRQELADYLAERKLTSDAATLGQIVRAKFNDERASIHAVIEEQLRNEEDVSRSFITARDPLLRHAARASSAHELAEYDKHRGKPQPSRSRGRLRATALGACLLAAAAAAFRLQSDASYDAERRPVQPAPAGPSARDEAERALGAGPLPNPPPAREGTEAPARESADPLPDASLAGDGTRVPPARSARPNNARGAPSVPQRPAESQNASRAGAGPTHSPAEPLERMEIDLQRVEPARRRPLDVSNPYR
jgi:serine/threonine-protein kinase